MFIASIFMMAALEASGPPPALSYLDAPPVRISSCGLTADPTTTTNLFAIRTEGADSVEISFVNQNVKPVSLVAIDVTGGGITSRIEDRGTFSRGIEIDHRFQARDFPSAFASVSCSVRSVFFADGTNWNAQ